MIPARTLVCGFLAGALLSAARVSAGHDLFSMPAVGAGASYGMRAAGLLALGLAFAFARTLFVGERRPALGLLLAALLGYAGHARLRWSFEFNGIAIVLLSLAGLALALFLVSRTGDSEPAKQSKAVSSLKRLGLASCGAGLALGFESLARHGRLLATQSVLDDDLFALVLLSSCAVGVLAFGPLLRSAKAQSIGLPISLALAALLCLLSLRSIALLSTQDGWDQFVRGYGMLSSYRGHARYDLVLGGVLFTLPSFALGAALSCARRFDFSALLIGAGLGLLLLPSLLGRSQLYPVLPAGSGTSSASLIPVAALVTSCGALLYCLATRVTLGSLLALALVLASGGFTFFARQEAILILAPWSLRPILPSLVVESPEGLLTIEPTEGGIDRVTLDRRVLAPGIEGASADNMRLETTFALLPESAHRAGSLRVLVIGQLTPGRALGLSQRSVGLIDRTAAWHASMPLLEQQLFSSKPPAGEVLAPRQARQRLLNGHYDLVWIPLVEGEAPCVDIDSIEPWPAETTLVAWVGAQNFLAQRTLPARGVLLAESLTQFSLALVRGPGSEQLERADPSQPNPLRTIALGATRQSLSVFAWLRLLNYERDPRALAEFSERLRSANREGDHAQLMQGLAHFHSIQRESSPWATAAEAIELDEEVLKTCTAAGLAARPDALTKRLIELLAEVLVGKRRIDLIERYVAPLAAAWSPWPELELALTRADLEGLLFERALTRARTLSDSRALALEAQALLGLERGPEAVTLLAARLRAGGLGAGGDPDSTLRRALADCLVQLFGEHALEELAGLGQDLATDARLLDVLQDRSPGHEAHEH